MKQSKNKKADYWNQTEEWIRNHELLAVIFILILSGLLILGSQYTIHQQEPQTAEKNAMYQNLIIEKISTQNNPFIFQNNLVYNGKKEATTPYHLIVAEISKISFLQKTEINSIATIFLWLLSIVTIVLFYQIMRDKNLLNLDAKTAVIASILLVISPLFIQTFSSSGPYALIVAITIAAIFLLFRKNTTAQYSAAALLAILPLFGIFYAITTLMILLAVAFAYKEKRKQMFAIIALVSIITVGHSILLYQSQMNPDFGIPQYPQFIDRNAIKETFSEVGGQFGFSIFALMLAILGITQIWPKKKPISMYLVIFAAVIFSIFFNSIINIYLSFAISLLAAAGLLSLCFAKWQTDFLKKATLLVILCGILFATISHLHNTAREIPSVNTIDSLDFIKYNTQSNGVILGHYSDGFLIEGRADRKVMSDMHTSLSKEEFQKINEIFYLRNMNRIKAAMNEYNIKYIFVTAEMRKGLVWNRDDEGILLILNNNPEQFSLIYKSETAEVWEFNDN